MSLSELIFGPLVEICEWFKEKDSVFEEKPIELPTSEYSYKPFRPQNFDQYIGQEKAKDIVYSYINAVRERKRVLPHILIHGKAGCGKTTLAKIISYQMSCLFKELISTEIKTTFDVIMALKEIDGGILFLDEVHSLDRETVEGIYSMMEDFEFGGTPIKPFTLIGATTELGEILRTRRPFVDRFKILIELEDYEARHLAKISKQFKDRSFPKDNLDDNIHELIGSNSRNTPRMAIRLTEATIYLNSDIKRVLYNFNIIKDGYTEKDLKILKYISMNEKGIGLQGLLSYMGTSEHNYNYEIEPYLLRNGLIIRTPRGRKITSKGKEKIIELEKENETNIHYRNKKRN